MLFRSPARVILDPQALRLAQWFAGLQERVGQVVEDRLHGACALQLEHVTSTLQSTAQVAGPPSLMASAITPPPGTTAGLLAPGTPVGDGVEDDSLFLALLGPAAADNPVDPGLREAPPLERAPECRGWKAALEQDIRPAIHRARGTLRAAAASFSDGSALGSLRDEVEATLARTPENLSLDVPPEDSSVTPQKAPARVEVPLRRWLREGLQPQLQVTLAEFNTRIAAAVHAATVELERIETVLDYHLFIVEDGRVAEQRDESARTGLGHGVRLVQQLAESLDGDVARNYRWFIATSSAQMDDALAPLRAHRPEEITQALIARQNREAPSWWSSSRLGDFGRDFGRAYGKVAPVGDALWQFEANRPRQPGSHVARGRGRA